MKTQPQMTKLEIIDELFTNGYEKDPSTRAVRLDGNGKQIGCYYNLDGKQCAVGKCLNEKGKEKFSDFGGDVWSIIDELVDFRNDKQERNEAIQPYLEEKYRGHSEDFWYVLQAFHDAVSNWDENGLTEKGIDQKKNLLKTFGG